MIYLLSDLHGDIDFPGIKDYIEKATEEDLLIILGDTCLSFEKTKENKAFTDYFLSIKKKIAIVDGNHENFAFLNSFPEEEWNGGTIRRLTENIILLKRGNVFEIEGKKFFVFGGYKSSAKWKEMGLWYEGDEGTDAEFELAYNNIKKHNYEFDYILTHKYEERQGRGTVSVRLQELTTYLDDNVKFKRWYAGHWHLNSQVDEKHKLVYDVLTAVEEKED